MFLSGDNFQKKEIPCKGLRTELSIIHSDFAGGGGGVVFSQLIPITLFFHVDFLEEGISPTFLETVFFP